nr:putative disease resistance protein RGA4 [Ipomoea batatas]
MGEPISTAISVARLILEKIAPFAKDQIKLLWGLNEELIKLGDLVSQIGAVQRDAEQGEHDNQTKNWLEKLKEIMDETNNLLDYFSPRARAANNFNNHNSNEDGCFSALSYFVSNPNPIVWVSDSFMARKIKSINERLDGIIKNKDRIRFQKQNPKPQPQLPALPPPEDIGSVMSWKFASAYMTTIYIKNCPPGKQLPPFHNLPSLEELYFESIMVDYIDTTDYHHEDDENNSPSKSQLFFPSLKKLWIWNCPNLKGWWKKKDEELLPRFPCISVVDIKQSPNVTWMPLFPTVSEKLYILTASIIPLDHTKKVFSSFEYLMKLWVSNVPDLEYMEIELFPSLEYLWVYDCRNLRHWGKEGDDSEASKVAPSVKEFEVKNCPKLTSLPQGMQLLNSSTKFNISGCPLLKQRYMTKSGQDWPEIANISTDW